MSKISATIVADSISSRGSCRITTFICKFPRFLLAEVNTHRMLSRNSASSRARPFKTMLKDVIDDPFVPPLGWMATHKGMQGSDYLDEAKSKEAKELWLQSRDNVVKTAKLLDELGVTKQFVNRLLEPYMWHEVIITGTEFENFFALRAHPDTEIHLCKLATLMLQAYNESKPKLLQEGEWHIPFGDAMDEEKILKLVDDKSTAEQIKLEIAAARCARISYKPFGSEDNYDYAADRRLFKTLVDGNHVSPLEHVARVMTDEEWQENVSFRENVIQQGWCGNFRGFIQLRKQQHDENRKDPRVVKQKANCTA